jgi:hypothetical protein
MKKSIKLAVLKEAPCMSKEPTDIDHSSPASACNELLSAAFVETAARAMWEEGEKPPVRWNELIEYEKDEWRDFARIVTRLVIERQGR